MHGAGNDFVVLDGIRQAIEMTPKRARALADRHFGIGADQVLLVDTPSHPEADFRYRVFNSDGSEVEHCGNGARCFVRFVHEQGLSKRNPLKAEIQTGLIVLTETDTGEVIVNMGQTRFEPEDLHFNAKALSSEQQHQDAVWLLPVPNASSPVHISLVAISNPHAVQVVENIETAPVAELGPFIESHPRFAQRVNAGFMEIVDRHTIKLRVYERGAGETLSCGTGACAAAVAGLRRGLLDNPVTVHTRGGTLTIDWANPDLYMTGPATTVFTGEVDIDKLTQND
ncbi:MAG TPA: diaminopimelate epimerase [Pusillimonas sp.]|nr:diaminopimelate epimerase [Pusillimonas sp.]